MSAILEREIVKLEREELDRPSMLRINNTTPSKIISAPQILLPLPPPYHKKTPARISAIPAVTS
jgi:hypothetical protein